MAPTSSTPEALAALYPDLVCTHHVRTPISPASTFAQQHAAALAFVRHPLPPAACQILADQQRASRLAADQAAAQAGVADIGIAGRVA